MSIMEAFAVLRAKYPEAAININPNFWSHHPGEYSVQWSVWVSSGNRLWQGSTMESALEKALGPDGNPEQSAAQVEHAVKEMASV